MMAIDLVGIAAVITAVTTLAAFLWTARAQARKNMYEHTLNRETVEKVFNVLKETIVEHQKENTVRLNALAVNQEVLFGMVADVDARLSVLADKRKMTVVRSRELTGVRS